MSRYTFSNPAISKSTERPAWRAKYWPSMKVEVARQMVSSSVAKGRWNRAMGLKKSVSGHSLAAIRSPMRELIPRWAVVFL